MTFAIDGSAGAATFSYAAEPNYANAVVYIFNRNAGTGIIATARADGSVGPTAPFPAALGDNVAITVLGVKGNQVRLGVNAPKDVTVHREEIYQRIQREHEDDDSHGR